MSTTNLGRVQGAGFFYANATSSTSVNKSSLTPSSIPALVGDTILFSDGDVRTITAISTSTVTCGNVITSLKGPQGIQGLRGPMGPSGLEAMSEAQLAAVNSGITSTKVEEYDEFVEEITHDIDNKVDKTTTASQVYGTDINGNQTSLGYSKLAVGSSIVQRKNDGQITVAPTPSANTDATSKSYVDGLFPTQFTNATANSTYVKSGRCKYIQIGKIVIVYIDGVQFKNVRQEHNAVIFSNLPTCVNGCQINLTSWGNNVTARYTMVENAGNIANYWSAFTPTESPEQVFSGMFMYTTT